MIIPLSTSFWQGAYSENSFTINQKGENKQQITDSQNDTNMLIKLPKMPEKTDVTINPLSLP